MSKKSGSYAHFSREERQLIHIYRRDGKSLSAIGVALGRGEGAAGSVSRELHRNRHFFPGVERKLTALERASCAHEKAQSRARQARRRPKLEVDEELRNKVEELITQEDASPRDISYRVRDELPGRSIAYTTIYNYTAGKPELRLHHRLRGKARKQRVTKRRYGRKQGLPPKRNIDTRPDIVSKREEYGHFESDTIHSCKNSSGYAILTVREIKHRMRWYFRLGSLEAEETLAVLRGFFRQLPEQLRKTLTVDNGPEFSRLYKLEETFPGLLVYSCDPYCAWQRGTSENANGELRWYYPKGTDFGNVPISDIWKIQDRINHRRMVCLGGRSPNNVFQQILNEPMTPELLAIGARGVLESAHSQQMLLPFPPSPVQGDLDSCCNGNILRGLHAG